MATYKRLDNLERIAKAYSSGKYASVDRVVIIWQDNTTSPPDWLLPLEKQPIPVHVRRSKVNSMNERFRLDPRIRTEAVFMVDDDLNIQSSDLELAFQTWKALGKDQRIVGFTARDYQLSDDRMTYMPFVAKSYSMILSNAAFLHRSFFEYYWSDDIRPYREYVDEGQSSLCAIHQPDFAAQSIQLRRSPYQLSRLKPYSTTSASLPTCSPCPQLSR